MSRESSWTHKFPNPEERSDPGTRRLRKAHSTVGMASSQAPRRSRTNRRASISTNFHGRPEGIATGLHLFPESTMASRRLSNAVSSERKPLGLSTPESSRYSGESDDYGEEQYEVKREGYDIKREETTPPPHFISAPVHRTGSPRGRSLKTETYAYSSLPTSPISLTPPPLSPPITASCSQDSTGQPGYVPFSLWDYLREELLATDFDSHQELKWERVSNFLNVPLAIEKVCLNTRLNMNVS